MSRFPRVLSIGLMSALAVSAPVAAQNVRPDLAIDASKLPDIPQEMTAEMEHQDRINRFVGRSVGAVAGLIAAEIVTGGMLLAPIGLSFATGTVQLLTSAAPTTTVTYPIGVQALSMIGAVAAAVAGGYIGGTIVPDVVKAIP